jgi:hypothetical protein
MPGTPAPDWHVRYRRNEAEQIGWFATPEEAIETACGLIDEGCDVYGIGAGSLDDSIAKDQIARIHSFWAKTKPHATAAEAPPQSR